MNRGENFTIVIFAKKKKILLDAEFDGKLNGAILSFYVACFGKKNEFENFTYGHF